MRDASEGHEKQFRPLPDYGQLDDQWLEGYDKNCYQQGMAAKVLHRTHALIERDFDEGSKFDQVLELGAGTLAHLPFVRHRFDRYIASDADAKVFNLIDQSSLPVGVELQQLDALSLPFEDNSFDRIIATHVLEHITSPHVVLAEWVRVLKPGGVLSIILPCDPGFAWRFGRTLGPRRQWAGAGLPYDYYMAREHVNSIFSLRHILEYHLPNRKETWWPLRIASPDLNLIYAMNAHV